MASNEKDNVLIAQHSSIDSRSAAASACAVGLKLEMPALVDGMDNAAAHAFNAWPERLYLLSTSGCIAYQGGRGPYGFDPEEFGEALEAYFDA